MNSGWFSRLLVCVQAALLASCATPEPGVFPGGSAMRGVPDPHAEPDHARVIPCREVSSNHYIVTDPVAARPGDAVELRHFMGGLYGRRPLPLPCVGEWRLDPPASGELSRDRRTLLVSPDVVPGRELELSATANGHIHRLRIPILAPDQLNLYGNWTRLSPLACDGSLPPREVRFNPDGTVWFDLGFSGGTRWAPIWPFNLDADTGRLTIADQGGRAELNDEGHLVLTGFQLPTGLPGRPPIPRDGATETGPDWPRCQLVFGRTASFIH